MDQILNILRTLFVALIAFVIIFASYFFIVLDGDESKLSFGGSEDMGTASTLQSTVNLTEREIDLNNYLKDLESVRLDVSFFESIAFKSLKGQREKLPALEAGRRYPFQPLNTGTSVSTEEDE